MLDLFCYRRFGHNEIDEPSFTQPQMYRRIGELPTTRQIYTQSLIASGLLTEDEADGMVREFRSELDRDFEAAQAYKPNKADWLEGAWAGLQVAGGGDRRGLTEVKIKELKRIGRALSDVPEGFQPHRTIRRLLDHRREMIETGKGLDWSTAEALAFGSLLIEGSPVRLSGQDSARGTFSQRHSVLVDQESEETYAALNHLGKGQAPYEVIDSILSEAWRTWLRIWLQPRRTQHARTVGGAIRRLRQRRPGHHRPVRHLGRKQMAAHERARHAAAARCRGPGAGAFLGPR